MITLGEGGLGSVDGDDVTAGGSFVLEDEDGVGVTVSVGTVYAGFKKKSEK